jgi:ribulose 1,5-bisphosphate synthetase/thiazole synthase
MLTAQAEPTAARASRESDRAQEFLRITNRSIGTPYKQFHDSGRFDAIVIGSGIGGMGTAALLAKRGRAARARP